MASRRRPFVKIGRPKATPKHAESPMEFLRSEVPATAFKTRGRVGYKTMPGYHDNPAMNHLKRRDC